MNNNYSQEILNGFLSENRLRSAFDYLQTALVENCSLSTKINRLIADLQVVKDTYGHMSQWLFKGFPDPSRDSEYQKLADKVRLIGAELEFLLTVNNLGAYYAERRNEGISPVSLERLIVSFLDISEKLVRARDEEISMPSLKTKREELLTKIFRKAWILDYNPVEELQFVRKTANENYAYDLMAMIVAGLSLATLQHYDPSKFRLLLDIYDDISDAGGDERILARLLVSIILIMDRWKDKINLDGQLRLRFGLWSESIINYTRLRDVILSLIKTKDTDRVSRKIKDDVMPALMKTSPEIMRKLREGNGMFDLSEFEENPEWDSFLKDSGLQDKLMELNEMQMAGMDVMMQAFAQLKSFPFFRDASSWFLPFTEDHSALSHFQAYSNESLRRVLGDEMGFCDSDKYSFVLSLCSMPSERALALSSQMEAGFEQLTEEMKSELLRKKKSVFSTEVTKYSRDLFRFFRLFPRRKEYPDVFSSNLDFRGLPFVGQLLTEAEVLEAVAGFYFSTGYYDEALSLFENLTLLERKDRPLLEKIGYCYQVAGDYERALQNYEQADLFSSDAEPTSQWLLRKMALCCKVLARNEEAIALYSKASQREPEDMRLRLNLGHLLLKTGKVEDALKEYYAVNYHQPDNKSALRSLVRGEMKACHLEKARQHLDKLLEGEFSPYDRQLAGHLSVLENDFNNAAVHFKASKEEKISEEDHRRALIREMEFLQGDSYDPVAFAILLDNS